MTTPKKNLTDMSDEELKEKGYADDDGYWTDSGYDNATDEDNKRLGEVWSSDDD